MEEDPSLKRMAVTREVAVQEDEVLCGEVRDQNRQQKVLTDFISGQKVMAGDVEAPKGADDTHRPAEGGAELAAGHP